MPSRSAVRVVIVDDDLWVRTGRTTVLSEADGIEVTAALGPQEALGRPELWEDADVVLVDAYDPGPAFDHFPGAAVTRFVRSHPRGSEIRVVVVTGHANNDLLRLRMAQAGADLFYGHEDVPDAASLTEVILTARRCPTPAAVRSRPDAVIEWVQAHGYEPAFTGEPQKTLPFSRRAIMRIRRELGSLMGSALPDWREASRFVDRARGADIDRS